MILNDADLKNLEDIFGEIIPVDLNPFVIQKSETLKVSGEVKTIRSSQTINLRDSEEICDIVKNENIEKRSIKFKSIHKWLTLFSKKKKNQFQFLVDSTENEFYFAIMSKNTERFFKTNVKIIYTERDNLVIIAHKTPLYIFRSNEKLLTWCDVSNFKTIIID